MRPYFCDNGEVVPLKKKYKKPYSNPYAITSPYQNSSDPPQPLRPMAHVTFRSTGNYPKARLQRG